MTDIDLTRRQIDNITQRTKKVLLISRLNTTDAVNRTNVRIRPQDKVTSIIGVRVKVKVDLNEELDTND